ncbi:MAG: hypothetical protein MRY64_16400 [Hyphomonadaceae bacterium]|nr:hypothetical protein [Hyphomonadaceae bacterium]
MDDSEREQFAADHERLFRIVDFPELRTAFKEANDAAAEAKNHTRQTSFKAIILGAAGVGLLGIGGLVGVGWLSWILQAIALLAILFAGGLGFAQWLTSDKHKVWLRSRWQAERLRQFHFQYLLNNWADALAAMDNDAAQESFAETRRKALTGLLRRFGEEVDPIALSVSDVTHEHLWLNPDWKTPSPSQETSSDAEELALFFRKSRLGIQLDYTLSTLDPTANTPKANADWMRNAQTAIVPASPILALVALVTMLIPGIQSAWFHALLIAVGTLGLLLRGLDTVSATSKDADRYEVYYAQLRSLRDSFDTAALDVQLSLLRQVESSAYEEMRGFLKANQKLEIAVG